MRGGAGAGGDAVPPPRPVARTAELLGRPATAATPVGGGSICDAYQVVLADGAQVPGTVFAKTLDAAPADFFAAEAAGLARLRETGTVQVPEVYAAERDVLVLQWVEPGAPERVAAERFGRVLAALHESPAPSWGTPGEPCYLGPLPLTSPSRPVAEPAAWLPRRAPVAAAAAGRCGQRPYRAAGRAGLRAVVRPAGR